MVGVLVLAGEDSSREVGELSSSDRRLKKASAGARRARGRRTRGWSDDGPRERKLVVKLSDKEMAAIDEVCERLGMTPGAWVGEMAVRYARGQLDPIPADWRDLIGELVSWRTEVVRAGTVINQVARHANATGEFEDGAERLVALTERLLTRVDAATEQASDRVRRSR